MCAKIDSFKRYVFEQFLGLCHQIPRYMGGTGEGLRHPSHALRNNRKLQNPGLARRPTVKVA